MFENASFLNAYLQNLKISVKIYVYDEKDSEQNKMKNFKLIKRFIGYYRKYKFMLIFDLLCAALTTVCELTFPLIVRYLTDMAINDAAALSISIISKIAALYIILRLIDTTANYYMANYGHVMGVKIETDMRHDLFSHLQTLSYAYFTDAKVGQIMSRITSDLFDVTEFAHHCPEAVFITGLKVVVSFIVLFGINPYLTLIIFAILPLMLLCSLSFRKKMRAAFKSQRVQVGELNSQVEDSLLGIRVVKSFANEDVEMDKFDNGNKLFYKIKRTAYKYMAGFQSSNRFFEGFMHITVIVAGSIFMMKKQITPADLMAYLLYITTLLSSIRTLIEFTEQFQRGMTGIERFAEIMDERPEIVDKENAIELTNVKGNILFSDISFKYSDKERIILNNLSMEIPAGSSVALIGPSGSGKTTLCNLIPRFYDVISGSITIDGKDIRDVTIKSLRNNIGVVQQDVYLFSGTVRENIEYGCPGASMEDIKQAAKRAGADEFIESLPLGYDTYVGERGVKLSGGQKQRLSIARVFLKNPPILLLDEATSALDNESEKLVQKSLEELSKGRTVFTIAHRLSTIKNADVILVLTEDGIAEKGTHNELIEKDGIYARLYNM